jgi:hypothetical protein
MPVVDRGRLPPLDIELDLTAGIHAEDGSKPHGGLTNADIGTFHEFGLAVPQRSFLRAYFDANEARITKLLEDAVVDAVINGKDLESAALRVAVQVEGEIKERIYSGIEPGLSQAIKDQRGEEAVALLDTGQLIGAIKALVKVRIRD